MKRKKKDSKHGKEAATHPTTISTFHKTCKLSDLLKVCPQIQHVSKECEDEGTVTILENEKLMFTIYFIS